MAQRSKWLVDRVAPPASVFEAIALHIALRVEERERANLEPGYVLPEALESLYVDQIVRLEEHIASVVPADDAETVALLGWLAEFITQDGNALVAGAIARNVAGAVARKYAPANN